MNFINRNKESLFLDQIGPKGAEMLLGDVKTGLSIVWNVGPPATFRIDDQEIVLNSNCVFFLTEFHRIDEFNYEKLNVIRFNRAFYCVENDDQEVGCKGVLFFGASSIPKITIPEEKLQHFELLWKIFMMEMVEMDALKTGMLRALLKRFLILCLRVYRDKNQQLSLSSSQIDIVRDFNFLVEKHYKTHTSVSDYASLLNKSPKTLANIFKMHINRTPLQIIQDRRMLEARRLLRYTDQTIYEIADDLQFADTQSFSHFFKRLEGVPPTSFRSGQ